MTMNLSTAFFHPIGSRLRSYLWKLAYQHMARTYRLKEWTCMNYGFAPLDDPPQTITLDPADAKSRYSLQLYHHVAGQVDLTGAEVLEVGSGRGGGAAYVKQYLNAGKVVGVDYAKESVRLCNEVYQIEGLSFKVGNAQSLPFPDACFDVVLNVESSHCYASMETFLAQVKRVLRDGGYFLFADLRDKEEVDLLRQQLHRSGLKLVKESDITANVVRGLHLDSVYRTAMIIKTVKKNKVERYLNFAGTENSDIYRKLKNRDVIYLSCVLQK